MQGASSGFHVSSGVLQMREKEVCWQVKAPVTTPVTGVQSLGPIQWKGTIDSCRLRMTSV